LEFLHGSIVIVSLNENFYFDFRAVGKHTSDGFGTQ
jgi:hypothetical protein